MPKSVKEALEVDRSMGTEFRRKAIDKEMKNVMAAFRYTEAEDLKENSAHNMCHRMFDIKVYLTRMARLVAGCHLTVASPNGKTFSSVVSRDSLRILFTTAAPSVLDILPADVKNAYLCAPTTENLHTTASLEFGSGNEG